MNTRNKTLLWVSLGTILLCITLTIIIDIVFNLNLPVNEPNEEKFIVSLNL